MAFVEQLLMEWRIQRRRPFVWFCFVAFFAIAFGDTVQTGWQAVGNQWVNGASTITQRALIYSLLGAIAVAGIVIDPFVRDSNHRMQECLLTTPTGKITFGLARFLMAFLVVVLATMMFIPGMIVGTHVPGIPPELIGPSDWFHYAKALGWFLIPNYLLIAALVYVVGSRFESRAMAFGVATTAVAMWITIRMALGRDVLQQNLFALCSLLDPFATIASSEFTLSNTVEQNNREFAPLDGLLLTNRLIWLAVSGLMLVAGTVFTPLRPRLPNRKARKTSKVVTKKAVVPVRPTGEFTSDFKKAAWRSSLCLMVGWELKWLWRQPSSKICLLLVAFSLWWSAASSVTHMFSLPSTDLLIHNTSFYFDKILVLAIVWVAGDLVWRDKTLGVDSLTEAQPIADSVYFVAKTVALFTVVFVFWSLAIGVNISYQLIHGYFQIELDLYVVDTFVFRSPFYFAMAFLAISVQSLVRHRMIGIAIVLLIYVGEVLLDAMGWRHPLFRFGRVSHFWYSLMDGYGHFWKAHFWMLLYWGLGSMAIWIVGWQAWWRGNHPPARFRLLRTRLKGLSGFALAVLVIAFLCTGTHIWRQSTFNAIWPPLDLDRIKATVESKFGERWRNRPQPRIVEIEGDLDLFPSERRFRLKGKLTIENQSEQPISEVLMMATPGLSVDAIKFGDSTGAIGCGKRLSSDDELNVSVWKLDRPLPPNGRTTVTFETSSTPPVGFAVHSESDSVPEVSSVEVIGNGTA